MSKPLLHILAFIANYITIIIPLLLGVASFFFFLYIYPIIDKRVADKTGGYIDWMVLYLDRLFIKATRQQCLMGLIISSVFFSLTGFILTLGNSFLNLLFTISFLYLGWSLPRILISYFWKRRLHKFDIQLTDGLDLMSNSIKSGLNLLQIIQVVVDEMPNPLSQEFRLVLNQNHLGVSLDEALKNMIDRVPTEDLSMAINAILILRETGGDLSETFGVIANTIRERRKVEGRIRAIREQALFQSIILFILPFGIALAMYFMNPGYLTPLISHPIGYMLITLMFIMQLIGGLWLKKLVTIDV